MKTINTYYEDKQSFACFIAEHSHILCSAAASSVLVQVFSGDSHRFYIQQLLEDISLILPGAVIIGTTASGAIMDGEVSGVRTVLSVTVFEHAVIRGAGFPKGEQGEAELGRDIAALAGERAKALLLFGAGENVQFARVLKEIGKGRPDLIVAGGSAGDNGQGCPMVFYNRQIIECGFAGLVLEGDNLTARRYSHLGWQAIGREMTITEAMDDRVYTIDGQTAYQVYHHYLGIDKDSSGFIAADFPLMVERNGFLLGVTPRVCHEDNSISFFGKFHLGEKVRLGFGNAELILEMMEELCRQIACNKAQSIFVYSCECRRSFFRDLADMETRPLQEIAPAAGFFTTGEYYHEHGQNHLLNSTMTVLVLSECGDKQNSAISVPDISARGSYFDSQNAKSTGALKAMAHLINTVTAELEAANEELKFVGTHDSLTGTYNRTFFDREMKRLEVVDCSLGIIICDLDSLKLVNDTLGHNSGDRIICQLARIMQDSCRKEDVVARIGGDEFALIVEGASEKVIADICRRIQSLVQRARESDNLLHVSIGHSFRAKGSGRSLRDVFTLADNAMYRCKKAHKEQVQQEIMQAIKQDHSA